MKIYRERDAARTLNLSYGYLKELRYRGHIKFIKIGRAVRYLETHLEEFVNSRQVGFKN